MDVLNLLNWIDVLNLVILSVVKTAEVVARSEVFRFESNNILGEQKADDSANWYLESEADYIVSPGPVAIGKKANFEIRNDESIRHGPIRPQTKIYLLFSEEQQKRTRNHTHTYTCVRRLFGSPSGFFPRFRRPSPIIYSTLHLCSRGRNKIVCNTDFYRWKVTGPANEQV